MKSCDRGDTGSLADGSVSDAPVTEAVASSASRLLFPSERQLRSKDLRSQAVVEDEEADTDIDESSMISTPRAQPRPGRKIRTTNISTPHHDEEVSTPMAPRFGPSAPLSPPSTYRATRSKKHDMGSSPIGPDSDEAPSPFHAWATTKNPKKRSADSTPSKSAGHAGKRARS